MTCPEELYEDWAAGPRERARRLYLDLLRGSGQWSVLIEHEPTDEAAHRALMREHVSKGRLHAAIRQFQRLRTILRRDLGVRPTAATLALYREIIGTAASGSVRPGLVGREIELVRARSALKRTSERRPAAILVIGPAGIGKTRLCEELVDQAASGGWLALRAAAREPSASVPYAALTEAMGACIVERPELAANLDKRDRQLLAKLDGTVGSQLPVPVHRQSVLHLLMRLAAGAGTSNGLLFPDDLQHADDATLEVVHVLASAPFPRGMLVIASIERIPRRPCGCSGRSRAVPPSR